jgi:hypothetical protein
MVLSMVDEYYVTKWIIRDRYACVCVEKRDDSSFHFKKRKNGELDVGVHAHDTLSSPSKIVLSPKHHIARGSHSWDHSRVDSVHLDSSRVFQCPAFEKAGHLSRPFFSFSFRLSFPFFAQHYIYSHTGRFSNPHVHLPAPLPLAHFLAENFTYRASSRFLPGELRSFTRHWLFSAIASLSPTLLPISPQNFPFLVISFLFFLRFSKISNFSSE